MVGWFYSYSQKSWRIEAFSLCITVTKSPSGPPWNKRAPALGSSRDQCARGPSYAGTTPTWFYFSSSNIFITCSLYTVRRHCTSPGAPDLRTRLGWLQGSTRNGMKWGTLTLLEISHSRGCYLKFAVLLMQKGVLTKTTEDQKNPGSCALVVYIAGDTLRHQPMGAGHMTVLQLRGPMGFRVLQWCHPMWDKLLYPDHHLIWCVESGFRPTHFPPLLSRSPTIVGGLQIILQPFCGLNPKLIILNTMSYSESYIFMGSEYTSLCKAFCTFITVT